MIYNKKKPTNHVLISGFCIVERRGKMQRWKKSKAYYLEKMRHGQITDEEVARIFNTSVSNVRAAFIEHTQKKNPFRKRNRDFIVIIEIFVSIASMLLVYFTLLEMQVARDNAYLPDVYFNKTSFAVTWDAVGLPTENYADDETFEAISASIEYIDSIPRIELTNIGMGTAKNIHIEWSHATNMKALTDCLYSINKEADFTYEMDNSSIVYTTHGATIQSYSKPFLDIPYMNSDTLNEKIMLPYEYMECIRHICYNYTDGGLDLPDIKIKLSYLDIQGKKYSIEKTIQLSASFMTWDLEDGSGYAFFEVREI